jgi:glycosyltransferase involved in cell wall biosynthesis
MKVFFSTDQIYLHGGIEKVMADKANYFSDVMGYEVFILTAEQKGNPACYPLSKNIRHIDIGINYHREKSYFHPANLAKIPKHFFSSRKTIKNINPDVVISCNYAFDFYWLPFISKAIPKLKEYHSSRYFEHKARLKSGFLKRLKFHINDFIESKFTRLILLNPDEKAFYGSDNLEVIPNPIAMSEKQARLDKKRVIAAGRIAAVKGFDTLIHAWKLVSEKMPGWQLHIFGQGEKDYIASLQKLIDNFSLQDQIQICSAVPDLQKEMLESSIYAMTSHTECYPMVLLEAASVGLPVVAFDCPTGPRHIVKEGVSGFLVNDQDQKAFAEKMISLAQDEVLLKKMGGQSKEAALQFSDAVVMQQWVSLFDKLRKS